jgi:hypothetical protein
MAMNALRPFMAGITGLVMFLECFGNNLGFSSVVTPTAVFLFVAVDTFELELLDVLLVVKRYDWSLVIVGLVDHRFRLVDNRVFYANDVGLILHCWCQCTARLYNVALCTFGVVTPLAVTRHALAVKGSFQPRFAEISLSRPGFVAFLTWWMRLLGWCVMVA